MVFVPCGIISKTNFTPKNTSLRDFQNVVYHFVPEKVTEILGNTVLPTKTVKTTQNSKIMII